MNKYGYLAFGTFFAVVLYFFMARGPNADINFHSTIWIIIAVIGLVCASLSKKWYSIIPGILLNSFVILFSLLLLFAGNFAP
ncbi:hypothetical protein ACQKL5_07910 [Peribacillus sp. NPDC097675]|uniref:hypothetical protein n=1 Tax=Peribacillus sp. NPDC097675 TaxID=3390618 RepID=UPI003D017F21